MKEIYFREPILYGVVNGQVMKFRKAICNDILNYIIGKYGVDNIKIVLPETEECIKKSNYGNIFDIKDNYKPFRRHYSIESYYKVGETVYLQKPRGFMKDPFSITLKEEIRGLREISLSMPVKHDPCFIKITGVKAERFRDINEEDYTKDEVFYEMFKKWKTY
jgi:hypothetical protein